MSEARARGSGRVEWSGRRGSNPRPTAWKAVTLPLSYSRLRIAHFVLRRDGGAGPPSAADSSRSASGPSRYSCPSTRCARSGHSPRLRRGLPRASRAAASRVVARGGFEPPKPLGRQIYSLLRLTASLPRRRTDSGLLLTVSRFSVERRRPGPRPPELANLRLNAELPVKPMELAKGFEPPTR